MPGSHGHMPYDVSMVAATLPIPGALRSEDPTIRQNCEKLREVMQKDAESHIILPYAT